MNLSIDNVINVSVSEPGAGAGEYNTSNLALFTNEQPAESFGDDGYKIYLEPSEVGIDFGTASRTYKMALKVFSQQPNILAPGGYLVVLPLVTEVQQLALSGVPASGSFTLNWAGFGTTAAIQWDDTAQEIQDKIRAVAGLEGAVVTGALASQDVDIALYTYGDVALPIVGGSGLQTSAPAAITITPTQTTAGESLAAAVTRTGGLVEYFGVMNTTILAAQAAEDFADVMQALPKMGFIVQRAEASVEDGGIIKNLATGGFDHSRGLYYGGADDISALEMMAAYAGRGLSVIFSGSNTTMTMHLKDLLGIQPDPSMTQTILNKCQAAGADTYVSIQGVPKVFCSGANDFFDNVYNLLAFIGDIKISGFNTQAQTATKIVQTEGGMNALKGGYTVVCEQYVSNQFLAPGKWTSPNTFGNQEDFYQNIAQRGYYIWSAPIASQTPAQREAREAPLAMIAIKYAGAIHKSSVVVFVNK